MTIADFCEKLIEATFDPTGAKAASLVLITFINLVIEEQDSIDKKLGKLIGSPYQDGLAHLENARDTLDEERKRKCIEVAVEKFITASNQESPLLVARAKFFVGVCFDLLNDKRLALKWYRKAYETGQDLKSNLQQKAKFFTKAKLSTREYVVLLFPVPPLIKCVAYLGYRTYERGKARQKLEDLQKDLLTPLSNILRAYRVHYIDA